MNAEQRGAEGLTRLLNLVKGVVEVRDELAELGNIKQAIAESKSRRDVVLREEAQASQRIADNIKAAEVEKSQAGELLRLAKIESGKIIETAQAKAADIVANAENSAKQLKDDARRELADAAESKRKLGEALAAVNKATT